LRALPIFLAKRCRLIDNATLRQQLASLERHVTGVRETVSHPSVQSAHDDLATSCCGALVVCGNRLAFDQSYVWVDGVLPSENYDEEKAREAEANAVWRRQQYVNFLLSHGQGGRFGFGPPFGRI
jgi:hypothetical protein